MNFKLILTSACAVLILASCSVTKVTNRTIAATETEIIIKPLLAEVDVDVSKKIIGTATVTRMSVAEAKELAKWDALEKSGADIMIDPIYKITHSFWRKVTVEVTGFAGKYTEIAPMNEADLKNLELYKPTSGSNETGGTVMTKLRKLKNRK
ncbi:MAG: molybdopterin-binding protein [Arenicella sp.]|jgi:molybdopterin-binding protein